MVEVVGRSEVTETERGRSIYRDVRWSVTGDRETEWNDPSIVRRMTSSFKNAPLGHIFKDMIARNRVFIYLYTWDGE